LLAGGVMERRTWKFEYKLCREQYRIRSFGWPCDPVIPEHDTFHEVTARRIWCIGSGCVGRTPRARLTGTYWSRSWRAACIRSTARSDSDFVGGSQPAWKNIRPRPTGTTIT
jgi:hypothetical protein